jgi:hypothetical protein
VKWSLFCTATGRTPRVDLDTRRWYDVADAGGSYEEKLGAYRRMADEYFETDRYAEFVATQLGDLDAVAHDYFSSADFDRLLVETVRATFPAHEHEPVRRALPRAARAPGTPLGVTAPGAAAAAGMLEGARTHAERTARAGRRAGPPPPRGLP